MATVKATEGKIRLIDINYSMCIVRCASARIITHIILSLFLSLLDLIWKRLVTEYRRTHASCPFIGKWFPLIVMKLKLSERKIKRWTNSGLTFIHEGIRMIEPITHTGANSKNLISVAVMQSHRAHRMHGATKNERPPKVFAMTTTWNKKI